MGIVKGDACNTDPLLLSTKTIKICASMRNSSEFMYIRMYLPLGLILRNVPAQCMFRITRLPCQKG